CRLAGLRQSGSYWLSLFLWMPKKIVGESGLAFRTVLQTLRLFAVGAHRNRTRRAGSNKLLVPQARKWRPPMKLHRSWSRLPLSLVAPRGEIQRGKSRSKNQRRRQRLGLELLETRIAPALSLTSITAAQAAALRDGLQGIANFGTTLDNFSQL